ncbi:MAG: YgaP family membrane protein [Burkholderiales bacterium]
MTKNQALWERILRIVMGIGLAATGYIYGDMYGNAPLALVFIGTVLIVTGTVAYCPAWHLLGFSTKRAKQTNS